MNFSTPSSLNHGIDLNRFSVSMKSDEIELLAKINDKRDIADMARNLGLDDKSIKAEL